MLHIITHLQGFNKMQSKKVKNCGLNSTLTVHVFIRTPVFCLLVYTSASSSLWPSSSLKSPPVSFLSTILVFMSLHLAWWSPRSQISWWWVFLMKLVPTWENSSQNERHHFLKQLSKMHQVFFDMLCFAGGPYDQEWASSSWLSFHWSWTPLPKSVFQQLHWWTHRALDRHGEPETLAGQTSSVAIQFNCFSVFSTLFLKIFRTYYKAKWFLTNALYEQIMEACFWHRIKINK